MTLALFCNLLFLRMSILIIFGYIYSWMYVHVLVHCSSANTLVGKLRHLCVDRIGETCISRLTYEAAVAIDSTVHNMTALMLRSFPL